MMIVMFWTGSFVHGHVHEPKFLLPGLLLHAWLTAEFAIEVYEIFLSRSIDFAAPVPDLQRRFARLCSVRVRNGRWALLTGQVVWWVPFAIVACKAVLGVDLYRIMPLEAMLLQVVAGVLLIPAILWGAKRLPDSRTGSRMLARAVDILTGAELVAARQALENLARFEQGADDGQTHL